jgi:protein-S-isoprenylcysteine O-methyltransferase Ste14
MQRRLIRALTAFLVIPGMVAFAIPCAWLWYTSHLRLVHPLGLILHALGFLGLLWSVRDFYVSGRGTLAPWAPPKRLVKVGLYRVTRNPMYGSVVLVLLAWAVSFASIGLLIYALAIVFAFHLRVVFGEEPWLARTYGREWEQYADRVPRWFRGFNGRVSS